MNTILILNERSFSCCGLLYLRSLLSCSLPNIRNEDFSALNKAQKHVKSFFKITPENDKINFAFCYQDFFAISLLLKYTSIHYLLFRNLKSPLLHIPKEKHLAITRHSIEPFLFLCAGKFLSIKEIPQTPNNKLRRSIFSVLRGKNLFVVKNRFECAS